MNIKKLLKDKRIWLLSGLFLIALPLAFNGCGTTYDAPVIPDALTTQTPTALISPATLQDWVLAGLVNGSGEYDRVVVLDVNTSANYTAGHIPGALWLDSSTISQTRTEGISASGAELLEGKKMDAIIQSLGITKYTTIVFTGTPASITSPTRAYFTFRYWGFPKNRLKVLDGLNGATTSVGTWANLYGGLVTTATPTPTASTYSVTQNGVLRSGLRVSLPEMIKYAEGNVPNALAIDVRTAGTGSYAGTRASTGSNFSPTGDYAVFEGRIRGAKALLYTSLYDATTFIFKPADQLTTSFTTIGLDSTKTAYIYCFKGFMGAVPFFVLDGILGWPVAFYDGSWSQWGNLSGNASMKGQLASNSPWRTDIPSRSELIVYNFASLSQANFFGTGLNDATTGGTPAGTYSFIVEIDGAGTPDTFTWSSDGGTTWTPAVPIDGTAQALAATGVTVTFAATTGHTLTDRWIFTAGTAVPVEQLTADGNACSARYNIDSTVLNSAGGTAACTNLPNSFDTSNRIEEADELYMKSGGSSGGSSGGGGGGVPAGGC